MGRILGEEDERDLSRRKRALELRVLLLRADHLGREDRLAEVERGRTVLGGDVDGAIPRVRDHRGEAGPRAVVGLVGRERRERASDGALRNLGCVARIDAPSVRAALVRTAYLHDLVGAAVDDALQIARAAEALARRRPVERTGLRRHEVRGLVLHEGPLLPRTRGRCDDDCGGREECNDEARASHEVLQAWHRVSHAAPSIQSLNRI